MSDHHIQNLLKELGLSGFPPFYRDLQFYGALLLGVAVLWAMSVYLFQVRGGGAPVPLSMWISMVLWQPLIEELLFRGILQGQLLARSWGRSAFFRISLANLVTSVAFMAIHFIAHPPLWAMSVLVPSLLFGYFRERHHSLYPAIILHSVYNLGFLVVAT
jgi:uncharacterized protein